MNSMHYTGTADLRAILEHELSHYFGTRQKIVRMQRRPSAYRTSFAIDELAVDLEDGNHLDLIFKNLSWQALSDGAQRVKPRFVHNPMREIEVYRTLRSLAGMGTAVCYGSHADEPCQRYWLFLERVPGLELYQIGDFAQWQAVARWLAGFHVRFAMQADQLKNRHALLRYDAAYYRSWPARACSFADGIDAEQRKAKATLTWLAAGYEKVVAVLTSLPPTLIHGEFYASNVLVQGASESLRVCPVDWEMAGWGPGLIDLAALTSGKWREPEQMALAMSYYEARMALADDCPKLDEFMTALDYCRLHFAVQWLGWAPKWQPPAENAHDWLAEAQLLAEKLAL